LQHAFQILKHFVVPESDYLNTVLLQKSRPLGIANYSFRFIVLAAIKLNCKLCLAAVKIKDKPLKWVLSAESETAKLFLPKTVPHQLFRIRHALTQGTGCFEQWYSTGVGIKRFFSALFMALLSPGNHQDGKNAPLPTSPRWVEGLFVEPLDVAMTTQ
jgi:hypothetical protein